MLIRGATHFKPCSSQLILAHRHTHTNPMRMSNTPSQNARVSYCTAEIILAKMNAMRPLGTWYSHTPVMFIWHPYTTGIDRLTSCVACLMPRHPRRLHAWVHHPTRYVRMAHSYDVSVVRTRARQRPVLLTLSMFHPRQWVFVARQCHIRVSLKTYYDIKCTPT